jgi:hypothetical protein
LCIFSDDYVIVHGGFDVFSAPSPMGIRRINTLAAKRAGTNDAMFFFAKQGKQ